MSTRRKTSKSSVARRTFLVQSAALALAPGAVAAQQPAPAAVGPATAEDLRRKLLECLGGSWPDPGDLKPIIREKTQKDGYRLESVTYEVEPGEAVPAYVLIPDGINAGNPAPAVAVWHQHNGAYNLGKVEPAGLAGSPMHHTGVALARQGYVVICPDALCFGERQGKDLRGGDFERFEFLRYVVAGKCLAWKNILDMRRAIDYLCARPEVQKDRIGCYGHSMGSTHTWLVGPWEPRLKCLVGNCCLPTYAAIHRAHLIYCFPNFIPGWFRHGDTPDIAGLIAPRRLHLNFGETDRDSPIQEVRDGVQTIALAYEKAGAAGQFSFYIEAGSGHVLSEEMWRRAQECFRATLRA